LGTGPTEQETGTSGHRADWLGAFSFQMRRIIAKKAILHPMMPRAMEEMFG
jgi:hypothetical protein